MKKYLRLHTETFLEGSHFLRGYNGKCANMHGHTWRIRLWIEGTKDKLDKVGILFDFGNLKEIHNKFDHKILNDLDEFKNKNPTAENISLIVYNFMKNKRSDLNFTVRVYETSLGKETYCEYGDFNI